MVMKWITVRLRPEEIEDIDTVRNELVESVGVDISRSAFLRGLILKNLRPEMMGQAVST
jgi:hypothetical protein|tara:strand:- start:109 stop:285 length:177 start_codon:yes stop_codon:yes gene_type:complete